MHEDEGNKTKGSRLLTGKLQMIDRKNLLIAAIVILVVLALSGFFVHTDNYGYGEVNLFTSADGSKNYRVDADITEHRRPFWQKTYTVSEITWPNNENMALYDCTMKRYERVVCRDIESTPWLVEINRFRQHEI